ncbi:hypothetical protein [Stakelama saccharophila]|uniref:Zinc transporter, ZIP family n=1 Tax=Stakelama saccharophila TaxID=3075605 RepID=A0ABZ0B4V5_9SPHN|nr:hypothetical protein [Stakelama sp. W311]WNO52409.1 hypothetical protein RPR59_07920 [Stakelama sp. W311]
MNFLLPPGFGMLSGLAILLGGGIASVMTRRRSLLLSLSSGAIFAIALMALLPEAIELAEGIWPDGTIFVVAALGYAAYLVADRASAATMKGRLARHLGPTSFFLHAFVDGLMAGVGFSFSLKTGLLMAGAAVAHGLAHGINTVSLVTARNGSPSLARRWLVANAAAPVLGAVCAGLLAPSRSALAVMVALFAGIFLFIATSDLLPEARARTPAATMLVATAIVAVAFVRLAFWH